MSPDFTLETELIARGATRVAGVDEVGRGPLAGPVTAAAVVLDPGLIPPGLNDCKVLSAGRREALLSALVTCAEIGLGHASVAEIDEVNILRASHLAMRRAVAALASPPDHVLVDGNMIPRGLRLPSTALVKGDCRSLSIAAASIVAKVTRDRIMVDLAQQFPLYGWETNMGYPSPAHKAALLRNGATPHHRRSFKPVHNILLQEKSSNP